MIELDGYTHDRPWLFKDPKLTLLWPTLAAAFPRARWVLTRRDEASVIRSCLRAPFLRQHSGEHAYWRGFVAAYLQRLEQLRGSGAECLEVHSERLAAGELDEFLGVLDTLGLAWDDAALRAFVDPEAWHHRATPAVD